jgi:hypothetical protein
MRVFCLAFWLAFILVSPVVAQPALPRAVASRDDGALLRGILDVLSDAVITRLDARVSLERAEVKGARVRLENLTLRDLNIGVLLSARGAKKLADMARGEQANALAPLLELARLGLFNRIEVSIRLRELKLRRLALDADDLDVRGLMLQVGATPPDADGRVRSDTLGQILEVLRHTALNQVKAHAALEKLAARRIRLTVQGVALQGFGVTLALTREESNTSETTPAVAS